MDANEHILIVDDDPILVETLVAFFRQNGFENCLTASDGMAALSHLNQYGSAIKMITCDLNMPDCDGVEFLALLKSYGYESPIVLITSATKSVAKSASTLAAAYGLNFLGRLEKPVQFDELTEIVAKLNSSKA